MNDIALLTYDELMNPLLQALRTLGGSGSIEEIYAKTVEVTGLLEDVRSFFRLILLMRKSIGI